MRRKRNIKSIVLLAALGIATLFFINISFASTNAKVNVETANLRESADENSKILEQLSQGQEVEIVEKSSDWYKVKVKGMTGYLRQDLLTVEEKNTVNAMTLAIKGMLPHNSLGRQSLKKLRVYAGAEHENQAQKPEVWEVK